MDDDSDDDDDDDDDEEFPGGVLLSSGGRRFLNKGSPVPHALAGRKKLSRRCEPPAHSREELACLPAA